ncbi:MAG TPA: VWA domain-containing protein [Vicinamibacterales bacterium]|nr:VWA domain-containing protein [Vicinamibacterales bacterium]
MREPLLMTSLVLTAAISLCAHRVESPHQSAEAQRPVFSSAADLVVVHVTVTDRRGGYVTGLPRDAFRIREDGVPQRIDFFSGDDSPVTVGLLVDSSASMREGRERVLAAAMAFARASRREDEFFGLAFNERVRSALSPAAPFTSDPNAFRIALAGAMGAEGRTAMYDAISTGLDYVATGSHPRQVLVLVGDGGDNASTTTVDQVLREAQASNAAIYTVGVVDPLERDANPGFLKRLARATGGGSFFPRRVDDVDSVLQAIARDIRHSYTLGYVSSNPSTDGHLRRIQVAVTDAATGKPLVVRAREGYRAGGP